MLNDDDLHWFPMRVSYSHPARLMKLKQQLDQEANVAQTYIPMEFKQTGPEKMQLTPAITNYIFIRVSLRDLRDIKGNKHDYEPLRYVMHPVLDANYREHTEVLYVPDKLMDDFIRVSSEASDKVIFLDNMQFACRPGQKVLITEGPFTGVHGIVKSIKKHLCVVIPIENVMAVAITNVPKKSLLYLPDEEDLG